MRDSAVKNNVRFREEAAFSPRAMARWLLPTPGGPMNSTLCAVETQASQLTNKFLVQLGLKAEVELLQAAQRGEVRFLDSRVDGIVDPGDDLLLQHGVQVFLVAHFG